MTSGKKRAELKRLSGDVRHGIHAMLKIAHDLLEDQEYVAQFGGGPQLIDDMQSKEFAHFGGSPTLPQMLRAYAANPGEQAWKEYDYNIWAMIELAAPAREAGEATHINWKAIAKELEVQVEQLTTELAAASEQVSAMEAAIASLETQNAEMRGELKALRELAPARV